MAEQVNSGNFLQWQEWMLALRREQLGLMRNLEEVCSLEETVKAAFEEIFAKLQDEKIAIMCVIEGLKATITVPIQQAIAETTDNCGNIDPHFQHPLSPIIWNRACSAALTPSLSLFLSHMQTTKELDIRQLIGISITPLSDIIPGEYALNLPFNSFAAVQSEKRDMELGYIQQLEKMREKREVYLQLLNEKNKTICELQNANEILLIHCLQPSPHTRKPQKRPHTRIIPSISLSKSAHIGNAAKQCFSCKKMHTNSLVPCPNECECEHCSASHIISEGRSECFICEKSYYKEIVGLIRMVYGACVHCGGLVKVGKRGGEGGLCCEVCSGEGRNAEIVDLDKDN